jgi:hypothetical protein
MTGPLTPEEELAIAEQRLKCMAERNIRALQRLRYLIFGQWILIVIWILANHFWR